MSDPIKGAERTATTLGLIKWTMMVLYVLAGAAFAVVVEQGTTWPRVVEVLSVLAGAVCAWIVYGLVGYLQFNLTVNTLAAPRELTTVFSEPMQFDPGTGVSGWAEPTRSDSTIAP